MNTVFYFLMPFSLHSLHGKKTRKINAFYLHNRKEILLSFHRFFFYNVFPRLSLLNRHLVVSNIDKIMKFEQKQRYFFVARNSTTISMRHLSCKTYLNIPADAPDIDDWTIFEEFSLTLFSARLLITEA
jgi:hypothetical protein